MGLRMKNLNILGFHWKIQLLGLEFMKKTDIEGDCLKKRAWTVFGFKGVGLSKKEWVDTM